ncbi:Imm40 family immunity protein [Luteibacter yeojuensis]|uniref:Immunity protein 40 domain-containing protein n=1 Tax=Luteibacter yeojuensis TaxID=345309 RepID=A0A0F3KNG5_9GAMM|nr:Imm40 family immunity protein [Luteibacter yeojuensis]KJV32527.1 hypothetical protein VI08_12400 [Luteibacter yeojuensis]
MSLPQRYADLLASNGLDLQEAFCIADIALDRRSTLHAIDILAEDGATILGGDVYLMSSGKLRLALANWYTEALPGESMDSLARRSIAESRQYVTCFEGPDGEVPYFSLVVDQI